MAFMFDRFRCFAYKRMKLLQLYRVMKFLLLIALLIPSLDGRFFNSPLVHVSDSLRLKCDALPYRTAYVGTRCYFAVTQEVKMDDASSKCNSIFPGAKVVTNAPNSVFNAMMLDKSRFHISKESSGKNSMQSICFYDSNYKCDSGELSSIFLGKCIVFADKKTNYPDAVKYCNSIGMEVPAIRNELENRMIRGALDKDAAWINNVYQGEINRKWNRTTSFSKFTACAPPRNFWLPNVMYHHLCPYAYGVSSLIDKTGYWWVTVQGSIFDVMCVKNAENAFKRENKICTVPLHKYDETTGECEWSGPDDACLQMIDHKNVKGDFLRIPVFPEQTAREHILVHTWWNDAVARVIVRRGCMYSGFGGNINTFERIVMGKNNLGYGEHKVPNYYFGDGLSAWGDGCSAIKCFCDPTVATLNGHVPAPPPDNKCIEHHVFNEETQSCEWKHEAKYCGELITNDGRRQFIEIPNWPSNRKYNVDHWSTKRADNFHVTVTEVIVRQHCWATLLNKPYASNGQVKTLNLAGYGKHEVDSFYNGKLASVNDGTHFVICECLGPENVPVISKKEKKRCARLHEFDEATGLCEWTGPKDACMQMIDVESVADYVRIPKFPQETVVESVLVGTRWNDMVINVVVRRGCMYSGFGGNPRTFEAIVKGKNNLGYGVHNVPSYFTGDLPDKGDGLSRVTCFCDPTEATLNDHVPAASPKTKCVEHHVFNETTKAWKHDPKFCGELITHDGRRQMIEIPNWPKNRKYDDDHWRNLKKQPEDFHFKITEVIVRQHCWATLYWALERKTLNTSGYGRHEVKSFYNKKAPTVGHGTTRVACECLH